MNYVYNEMIFVNMWFLIFRPFSRFVCNCEPGYHRALCELDMSECEISPCLDREDCVSRTSGYNCLCTPGYTGKPLPALSVSTYCSLWINGNLIFTLQNLK